METKTKIQIKSWMGKVLFEHESSNVKEAVAAAVAARANLHGADLHGADLQAIKHDCFALLLYVKKSLIEGKVDGSTYVGECACLCGTLEKSEDKELSKRIHDLRDSSRPIEKFFMGINKGDTPENNQFSKIALGWIEEFESLVG